MVDNQKSAVSAIIVILNGLNCAQKLLHAVAFNNCIPLAVNGKGLLARACMHTLFTQDISHFMLPFELSSPIIASSLHSIALSNFVGE